MHKEELRISFKALYKNTELSSYVADALSLLGNNRVFLSAQKIVAYAPMTRYEIPFMESLMNQFPHKQFLFPRLQSDGSMRFYTVSSYAHLIRGAQNFSEPDDTCREEDDFTNACVLVPALAVTRDGVRLGHGLGCYDKFLAEHSQMRTICIVPDFACTDVLPQEPHDVSIQTVYSAKCI